MTHRHRLMNQKLLLRQTHLPLTLTMTMTMTMTMTHLPLKKMKKCLPLPFHQKPPTNRLRPPMNLDPQRLQPSWPYELSLYRTASRSWLTRSPKTHSRRPPCTAPDSAVRPQPRIYSIQNSTTKKDEIRWSMT